MILSFFFEEDLLFGKGRSVGKMFIMQKFKLVNPLSKRMDFFVGFTQHNNEVAYEILQRLILRDLFQAFTSLNPNVSAGVFEGFSCAGLPPINLTESATTSVTYTLFPSWSS